MHLFNWLFGSLLFFVILDLNNKKQEAYELSLNHPNCHDINYMKKLTALQSSEYNSGLCFGLITINSFFLLTMFKSVMKLLYNDIMLYRAKINYKKQLTSTSHLVNELEQVVVEQAPIMARRLTESSHEEEESEQELAIQRVAPPLP